jgi:circadian clock protein KaiC
MAKINGKKNVVAQRALPKTRTGVTGFDEITEGGLPTGRTSLICGEAGSCKRLHSL